MGITIPVAHFASQQPESIDLENDSSQYCAIAHASQSGLDLTDALTIESWVKAETLPASSYDVWVEKAGSTAGYFFALHGLGSSLYELYFLWANSTNSYEASVSWAPSIGVWYHVAVTYIHEGGGVDTIKFYVNGVKQGDTQQNETGGLAAGSEDFYLGAANGNMRWDGKMCETRIWSDIRSGPDILDNKDSRLTSGSNLVSVWPFRGNANDVVGANNLTAYGSPVYSTDKPASLS